MPKAFMIFVEGMEPPKKAHNSINSAWREMSRLSELNPDKEVIIFQITKRMKWSADLTRPESIGSHFPPDCPTNMTDIKNLVRRKTLPKKNAA